MPILLPDLVRGLDMSLRQLLVYVHQETGKLLAFTKEDFAEAAVLAPLEHDYLPEGIAFAHQVLQDEHWLRLPGRQEVSEYEMMRRFVERVGVNEQKVEALNRVLASGFAEMRWETTLLSLNLKDDWFRFRRQMLRLAMQNWCLQQGLAWEDDH